MAEDKENIQSELPENEQVNEQVVEENLNSTQNETEEIVLEAQMADLKAEIEEKDKQLQESSDRLKRLQADFDNFRRRTRQEKEEISAVVVQNLIKDLLPLVDNFERALAAAEDTPFKDGIQMIAKQLLESLEKNGLEKINAVGEKFDPNYHEAIMRVADDTKEDDVITEELQKGYSVRGRVIRPTMVKVVAN